MAGVTKAYVLEDGEVIGENVLEKYAIKPEDSKQIPYDRFKESYSKLGLVEPLYNPEALAQLLEINTYHYRACKTKARDTAGLGWTLEPAVKNPSEQQREKAEMFLNNPNHHKSLTVINDMVMVDYEATGDGYYEVMRAGDEIVGIEHIPSHTMRVHTSMDKYCQIRGNEKVWFKRYGLEQDVDYITGEIGNDIPEERKANEVIHIKNYTSRSDFYGVPDVLPALGVVLGDRKRQEYNIAFFENHAIPAYVVTITGAELDDDTERAIQRYFQHDVKKSRHSTLVLSAQKAEGDYSNEPIEIKFQALSTEMKDASFRLFRQDNRDEILSAHGVPPYRAGIAVEGSLGGNIAEESTEIYKQSIIEPRQEMIENVINRYILQQGLGITDWFFKLKDIDTRDVDKEIERLETLFNMGVYSPNMVREKLGEDTIDNPNMDMHYINGVPIDIKPEEQTAITNALKDLHEQLIQIATKETTANDE